MTPSRKGQYCTQALETMGIPNDGQLEKSGKKVEMFKDVRILFHRR